LLCTSPSSGQMAWSTCELTWGLIIASVRHLTYEVQQLKEGRWQSTVGMELYGKTLGIYGLGKIGGLVAQAGRAFGMKISCWGRESSKERARKEGFEVPASREAFFAGADVLTLHLFANESTRGIVKAADLACMKPTALFVNTGRSRL